MKVVLRASVPCLKNGGRNQNLSIRRRALASLIPPARLPLPLWIEANFVPRS